MENNWISVDKEKPIPGISKVLYNDLTEDIALFDGKDFWVYDIKIKPITHFKKFEAWRINS